MALDILARIKKLLAHASNNPNENEVAVMLARAQALMEEHGIALADLAAQGVKQTVSVKVHENSSRFVGHEWYRTLFFGVAEACSCAGYTKSVAKAGQKRLFLIGRDHDVAAASELLEWLRLEVERLADDTCRFRDRRFKDSYKGGVALRLRQRLTSSRSSSQGLVLYKAEAQAAAQDWIRREGLVLSYLSPADVDKGAQKQGYADGARADLSAPKKRLR